MPDEHEPEIIKQQMEETRASLTEKVEALETQVVSTVQNATAAVNETVAEVKEAVHDTVETVRDTVKGTVESVKETVGEVFDLRRQMERRPLLVLGSSAALGFLVGRWLRRPASGPVDQPVPEPVRAASFARHDPDADTGADGGGWTATLSRVGHDWLDQIGRKVQKELAEVGDLAIAAASSHLKDMVAEALPKLLGGSHEEPERATGSAAPPHNEAEWAGPRAGASDFVRQGWRSEFSS
jgi:ElaB/YqjD/DUF883 family membrane-anchored ribosome-binding protein